MIHELLLKPLIHEIISRDADIQIQTFLLNSNKPDFEVTDLPQALELAEQNGLITIAVGDLHRDEWQQRSLTAIELPFSISSDIGLWRMRSRQLTPSLVEMIKILKTLKSSKRPNKRS